LCLLPATRQLRHVVSVHHAGLRVCLRDGYKSREPIRLGSAAGVDESYPVVLSRSHRFISRSTGKRRPDLDDADTVESVATNNGDRAVCRTSVCENDLGGRTQLAY
jgi:hypothetical protein